MKMLTWEEILQQEQKTGKDLKSKNGILFVYGHGILLLTIALFAETTSWIYALNAKPIKHLQQMKNVQLLGEFAITPSISIVFLVG